MAFPLELVPFNERIYPKGQMKKIFKITTEDDTKRLARALAALSSPATALLLQGDLGAGKTTLTRYLCQALGIDPKQVASPTFSIIHEYEGGMVPVAHVDLYRLGQGIDLYDLGLDEYIDRGFFIIIEWAQLMDGALDFPCIRVNLRLFPNGSRQAVIEIPEGQENYDQIFKDLEVKDDESIGS